MIINTDSTKPIYIQVAEWLETEILMGSIKSDEKVYSQYQLAEMFNINPATAAKGLTILFNENVLYKKRGLGMFVTTDAQEIIRMKRRDHTLKRLVKELVSEARQLSVSEKELVQMIIQANREEAGEEDERR